MKNALLTTTLAVLTGFAANAQMNQKTEFSVDARHPKTKTNIHVNKGDTVFVHAMGQAYCNPGTVFPRSAGPEGLSDYSKGINYSTRGNPRFGALVIGHASSAKHFTDRPYRSSTFGGSYGSEQFADLKKTPKGEAFYIARSKDEIVLDINDMNTKDNIGTFDVGLRVAPKLVQN